MKFNRSNLFVGLALCLAWGSFTGLFLPPTIGPIVAFIGGALIAKMLPVLEKQDGKKET
jgi:hypothetical protein